MRLFIACILLLTISLTGCASRKNLVTETTQRRIGTADLEHLPPPTPEPLRKDQKPAPLVLPPHPVTQSLPQYPQGVVEAEVSCSARLLYHVERDGSATLVRLEWEAAPPDEHLKAFEAAIRTATATWEFVPARKVVPVAQPDGSIEPEMQPVAEARRAIIRFRVEGGKGVVE